VPNIGDNTVGAWHLAAAIRKKTLRGTGCGVKRKVVELLADAKISRNFVNAKNQVRKLRCKNYQTHSVLFFQNK
jgi:hypothetical protein